MSRKLRQYVAGGIYHIIQRGHNHAYIFNDQTDKSNFLDMVKGARDAASFHVLYYVLMDNHYHLILEMKEFPLNKAMQKINMSYSKYFNKKYQSRGAVYGERYKAFVVSDANYLLKLITYIANNPVKASIVKNPVEYRWCAHMDVASSRNALVATRRLFEILGSSVEKGAEIYKELIRQSINRAAQTAEPNESHDRSASQGRNVSLDPNAFDHEHRKELLSTLLEDMLCGQFPVKRLTSGSRDLRSVQYRRVFIRLATERGFKTSEIAHLLNVTSRCVRNYRD